MNKVCVFTIADDKNLPYAKNMEKSLRHFHKDVDFVCISGEDLQARLQDPMFFYRATPVIGLELLNKGYEYVVKIDADSLILGDISEAWTGDFDVACVNNSNPMEMKKILVQIQGVHPLEYVNCGFVSMRSKQFVEHWNALCYSNRFDGFQFKEQDLLNILVFFMPYRTKLLDSQDSFWGLAGKGYYPFTQMKDGKVYLPRDNRDWPMEEGKFIKIYHHAEGNVANKMNYKAFFPEDVSAYIDGIINEE